jgi:hypothetical protein
MSTASTGAARERRVRDRLEAAGYPFVMRAAASKGAADLLHGHPFVGAVLVQVGTGNKTLGPDDRDRFVGAADLVCALPVLAQVIEQRGHPTEVHYWVVTRDVPATWKAWEL